MHFLSSSRSQSASRKHDRGDKHDRPSKHDRPKSGKPSLVVHVPSFGIQYLTLSGDNEHPPREIKGELEVRVPPQMGARRCKRLRIGFRTVCRLAMGDHRGWEEDTISQETRELPEMVLRGSTRIDFIFTLDPRIPAHDWHPEANIRHEIWAEMEGVPTTSFLPKALRLPSRSPSASRQASPGPSRRQSPTTSPGPSRPGSPGLPGHTPLPDFSQLSVETIPRVPSYEQSMADATGANTPMEDVPMLEGIYRTTRNIRVAYNPSSTGGTSNLDDRLEGSAPGLGPYRMHLRSPLWVVSAILFTRFHFLDLPATLTLFDVRVIVQQTLTVRSPRDGETHTTHRPFPIFKLGHRPSVDMKRPPVAFPALWRGTEGGGEDSGEWTAEGKGRLPTDEKMRPSTLERIITPVHVSHKLVVEATFSIWGLNADDTPLPKPGPGESRRLKLSKAVIVPGCPNIPQVLGLPEYETRASGLISHPNTPCPLCKMPFEDRVCTSCSYLTPTHPRHDHPPKLVGSVDGTCPVCSVTLLHEKEVNWVNCACVLGDEDMEKLAAGMLGPPELGTRGVWREADAGGSRVSGKEEQEYETRGRDRTSRR